MEKILDQVRGFDKNGALEPFLKSNAYEFEKNPAASPKLEEILEWSRFAGVDAAAEKVLMTLAEKVLADKTSSFLYFHCCRLAYDFTRLYPDSEIMKWPSFDSLFPRKSNLFHLLVAVSLVPRTRRIHRALKVSSEITRDTCGDIASRIEISREFNNGEVGISLNCMRWLRLHAKGDLFQFGRLQFHPVIFNEPLCAFRRISNGEVILLSEPGQRFTKEGYYDGAGGKLHNNAWFSVWEEKNGTLTANRFSDHGLAQKETTTIKLDEWRLAVDSSSAVMNTHIPRGRRITMEDWRNSIRRGFEFYRAVRTASARTVACACKSWMFDPRLQELLPENSGLVTLQRKVNLFPLCSMETRCGFYFIFGDNDMDIEKAPENTSLRKSIISHMRKGGALSGGGMLLFEDEISRFV